MDPFTKCAHPKKQRPFVPELSRVRARARLRVQQKQLAMDREMSRHRPQCDPLRRGGARPGQAPARVSQSFAHLAGRLGGCGVGGGGGGGGGLKLADLRSVGI